MGLAPAGTGASLVSLWREGDATAALPSSHAHGGRGRRGIARLGRDDGVAVVRLFQAREGIRRKRARMAGSRRQGSRVGEIWCAVRRILRTVGPEVSPSGVAPLDARRPRPSRARVSFALIRVAPLLVQVPCRLVDKILPYEDTTPTG